MPIFGNRKMLLTISKCIFVSYDSMHISKQKIQFRIYLEILKFITCISFIFVCYIVCLFILALCELFRLFGESGERLRLLFLQYLPRQVAHKFPKYFDYACVVYYFYLIHVQDLVDMLCKTCLVQYALLVVQYPTKNLVESRKILCQNLLL